MRFGSSIVIRRIATTTPKLLHARAEFRHPIFWFMMLVRLAAPTPNETAVTKIEFAIALF